MSRANQWFVPGDGIAREVITADIQRYLGPDALVRPGQGNGEYEGRSGYWITAYRTLTSQMIQDLKMDSQRWQQERAPGEGGRGVAYQDSRTHAARQHWGPSEVQSLDATRQTSRQPYSSTTYATSEHYTTTPTSAYGQPQYGHQAAPASHAAPRTAPPDPYAYAQPGPRDHGSYSTAQYSTYPPVQSSQDPYGHRQQAAPTPSHPYQTNPSAPAPGYYIASDGRQYPIAQQPQPPNSNNPRRRG